MASRWLLGGVVSVSIGLVVWATMLILVPIGVILLAVASWKQIHNDQASPSA